MAKGIVNTVYSEGLLGVYNALNTLEFVTAGIGTQSATSITFTSPLCESGTGIRITMHGTGTTNNNGLGVEVGSVVGTTYTKTRDIMINGGNSFDKNRNKWDIIYDTIAKVLILVRSNEGTAEGDVIVFTSLDSGKKIVFTMSNEAGWTNGIGLLDSTQPLVNYKVITFKDKLKNGGLYYEQPIRLKDETDELLMNALDADKVVGLTNVSISFVSVLVVDTDWVLVGSNCIQSVNSVPNNLYTYLKFSLI